MKNICKIEIIISLLLLAMIGLTSCLGILCINGNGILASEERSVSGFNGIENSTSANVHFTMSEEYSVQVEADANILQYINTSVSSGILEINIRGTRCIRPDRIPVVYVSGPEVSEMFLSGSGDMFADTLGGADLDIANSGSGNIIINYAQTSDTEISNSGSGNISLQGLYSDEAVINITGSGDIILEGELVAASINSTGSGNFNGSNLSCDFCNTLISGSGNVFVYVEDELVANLTGSGNLYYAGYPDIYENITGSGRIININK